MIQRRIEQALGRSAQFNEVLRLGHIFHISTFTEDVFTQRSIHGQTKNGCKCSASGSTVPRLDSILQKKFHSDNEVGLGPLVAGLSLGSPALMHFRLHHRYDPEREKRGIHLTIVLRHVRLLRTY